MIDFVHDQALLTLVLISTVVMAALVGAMLLGMRFGRGGDEVPGVKAVEASVFGLFGLIVALTFSGAAERYHARRALILEECKAITTAWSRLDVLSDEASEDLRARFRSYVDAKIAAYEDIRDLESFRRDLDAVERLGAEIEQAAASACRAEAGPLAASVMPPINDMTSLGLERKFASSNHPPLVIYALLLVLALITALLVGMGMSPGKRSWIHVIGFAAIVTATLYVTMDLETPRLGLIRIGSADAMLRDARSTMGG